LPNRRSYRQVEIEGATLQSVLPRWSATRPAHHPPCAKTCTSDSASEAAMPHREHGSMVNRLMPTILLRPSLSPWRLSAEIVAACNGRRRPCV